MICRTFCTDTASVSCHGSRCCLAQPSLLRCNADSGKIPLTHSIVLCCFSSYAQLTNECSLFTMAVISLHQLGESYQYAFAHGKMSNKVKLQDGTYDEVRARFHLPSQMACSVPRQVGATYKGLWQKVKQNAAARKAGQTKKRYKGLDQAPKYVSPTFTYQDRKAYTFKHDQQVSVLTLDGRVIVSYTGYAPHVALIQKGEQKGKGLGAANLWYDRPHKRFYLLVSLEVETADPTPETHTNVVGVDVGVRYLAVTSNTKGECSFSSGKQVVPKANNYARLRNRL